MKYWNKMIRKMITAFAVALSLCGCYAGQSSVSSVTVSETETQVLQLIETLEMTDMTRVKDRVVLGMVFGGDQTVISDSCMYRSSEEGNYDMVGIFYTDDMEKCREYIDEYLLSIKEEGNLNYPEEVFKISNAVEKYNDSQMVLIICDNIQSAKEQALEIIGDTE